MAFDKDRVQLSLDHLSRHYQDVAAQGETDEIKKWARTRMAGYDRAAMMVVKMTDPVTLVNGRYLIPSRSHADRIYRASSDSCNCEAGTAGAWCWHMALADSLDHLAEIDAGRQPTLAMPGGRQPQAPFVAPDPAIEQARSDDLEDNFVAPGKPAESAAPGPLMPVQGAEQSDDDYFNQLADYYDQQAEIDRSRS